MPRTIAIVMLDGHQPLDVLGPYEVFAAANAAVKATQRRARAPYEVVIVGPTTRPVISESGVGVLPQVGLRGLLLRTTQVDTLMVSGGRGPRKHPQSAAVLRQVQQLAAGARRVSSVCTGAFVLGRAGLLTGKRVTTHWAYCAALAREFPACVVDPDPIYVRDGNLWTSAGVTAGIDLSLAMVEEDLGREVSLLLARQLVMFVRRSGGQAQFSARLADQSTDLGALGSVITHIHEYPGADLGVPALARRARMSVRHFTRSFAARTSVSPARYVERVRVDEARRLLEDSEQSVELVAERCGYGTPESLRRALQRHVGLGPREYRARFGVAPRS